MSTQSRKPTSDEATPVLVSKPGLVFIAESGKQYTVAELAELWNTDLITAKKHAFGHVMSGWL